MKINWKTEKKRIMVERTVNVVDSITLSSKESKILSVLSLFHDQVVEAIENYLAGAPLTEYVPDANAELSDINLFLSEFLTHGLCCDGTDLTTKDSDTINPVIDMNDTHEYKPIIYVGDTVKVVRKADPDDWGECWMRFMDHYIGDTFEVLQISEKKGYKLDVGDDWWWFPSESLEKVV